MRNPKNYSTALSELQEIRTRLEGDLTDLDNLLKDVTRADFLLNWCRNKLEEVETKVTDILDEGWSEEE